MKTILFTFFLLLAACAHGADDVQGSGKKALTDAEIDIRLEAKFAAMDGDLEKLKDVVTRHKFLLKSEQFIYELFGKALYRDHFAVADFLLPYIRNYDYITEDGGTYLMRVVMQRKNYKYLKFFLKNSSLINYKAEDGDTAFSSAAAVYNLKAMKMLIEHGAKDLDSHTIKDSVPLNVAVAHGDAELVEMMLKRGADPNHQYEAFYRQFPLQIAAEKGFAEIAELLLKYKADPNKLTCYGETPLYLARRRLDGPHFDEEGRLRDEKLVAVLKRYGAKMPETPPPPRETVGGLRRVGC